VNCDISVWFFLGKWSCLVSAASSELMFTCREQTATCGESLCDVVRHHMLADDGHGTLNEVRHQTAAYPTCFHGDEHIVCSR
jgi:hypothetical protein